MSECECWEEICVCKPQEEATWDPVGGRPVNPNVEKAAACDSELAEIRKRLDSWPYDGWAVKDCHTLLRMVDELTAQNRELADALHETTDSYIETQRERDELRATSVDDRCELATLHEVAQEQVTEIDELTKERDQQAQFNGVNARAYMAVSLECVELRAKLAEAEKRADAAKVWVWDLRDNLWSGKCDALIASIRQVKAERDEQERRAEAAEARVKELEELLELAHQNSYTMGSALKQQSGLITELDKLRKFVEVCSECSAYDGVCPNCSGKGWVRATTDVL